MQKKLNYLLILLIVLNVLFVSLGAYLYPLASIDAVSIWYLKAKAIFLEHGNIPIDILKDSLYLNTHPQYPILVPFIFYLTYLAVGGINENIVAFINPLLYLLILFVVYKLLKTIGFNTTLSLLFTYIYSMLSPLLAQGGRKHSGDADIFIVFINWLAILLSFGFIKNKNYKFFWALVILIMISSQVKGEGLFLASILLFLPVAKKVKLLSIVLAITPFLIWRAFIYYNQIPNDFYFIIPSIKDMFTRTFEILYYTLREMIKLNNWYFFWPVFLIFAIFGKWNNAFVNRFILPSLTMIIGLFFASYFFSSINPLTYVPSSMDRVLLQLSPFYFLIFAMLIKENYSKKTIIELN